jgi:hypothetical protein
MSDTLRHYEDEVGGGARVLTIYDADVDRWTTTIVGGPIDGWSATYRDDADPVAQHARAIETAIVAAGELPQEPGA